jgi:hypothetical protein
VNCHRLFRRDFRVSQTRCKAERGLLFLRSGAEEYVPHPVPQAGVEKTGAGPAADPKAPFTEKWEQITYWLMANPKGAARTFSGNSNVAPQTCLRRKALRRSSPHAYGSYLFSWLLDVLVGYGYKPGRTVFASISTILSFVIIY